MWECETEPLRWNTAWQLLKKLNRELPYDPAIPCVGVHPRGLKTGLEQVLGCPCSFQYCWQLLKADTARVSLDGGMDGQDVEYYSAGKEEALTCYNVDGP